MAQIEKLVTVTIGDGLVVVKREGQSAPVLANILGVDKNENGEIVTIWLDRLVHRLAERKFVGWNVSGAVSTVLKRAAVASSSTR